MSFCRITGNARNLPKPHYFPMLPPISPADAKKLCRITGKAYDIHHFCPIVAFGKPFKFEGACGCRITMFEDFTFAKPIFALTDLNERSFSYLDEVLTKMRKKKKKTVDTEKTFAYNIEQQKITLIVPAELEEAIRHGEIETLSLSKDCKTLQMKVKCGRIIKLGLENVPKEEVENQESLTYGEGQNKKALKEQQKLLAERTKRKCNTGARRKLFEDKEKKEDESERSATERPKSKKPLVFSLKKRQEKLDKMGKMIEEQKDNKSIILPEFNVESSADPDEVLRYEQLLEDIAAAQISSHSLAVCATEFDWRDAAAGENGFDWEVFPSEEGDVDVLDVEPSNLSDKSILRSKALISIDIVAAVETLEPVLPPKDDVLTAIKNFKAMDSIKHTENVAATIKTFSCEDFVSTFDELGQISKNMHHANIGFLVQQDGDTKFVPKSRYVDNDGTALSGALVEVDDKQGKKFVSGQIIHLADEESFVAGQTIEDEDGKRFVPGHTVLDNDGEIRFIPGQSIRGDNGDTFLAGQTIETKDGVKFLPGQLMDRGDGKPIFVSGQTVTTSDGPKFVPGEIIKDEDGFDCFIPGMPMPCSDANKFIPGQTFQDTSGNVSFTPGQIVDTVEGPAFVTGKTFAKEDGKKQFIRGEMVKGENGKIHFKHKNTIIPTIQESLVTPSGDLVIPSEELVPIAIAGKDVSGFVVNPSNTNGFVVGQKLLGDMVETETTVEFYLDGKLPEDFEAVKIISGQLNVGEADQRFIPGKMIKSGDTEKFVPGQLVTTHHGEEFVPGQIVETKDGPKFIPGQMVNTAEGEKFVPGQVILEEAGPKFVPGQIIQTKKGATFIPGQMMNTDEGQKFVPGQLVETVDGPMFVPGQVIETAAGPKFTPGTVIETEEGLKYVPHDAEQTGDEEIEISFQGFEVTPEELHLLSTNPVDTRAYSPFANDQCLIDTGTLKKLATDTMEVRGTTPEPETRKRKKSSKKVAFNDLDNIEDNSSDEFDEGTDKVELINVIFNANNTVSKIKRSRELKKLSSLMEMEENLPTQPIQTLAIAKIMTSKSAEEFDILKKYLNQDEDFIDEITSQITSLESLEKNTDVKKRITEAVQSAVTEKCNKYLTKIINRLTEDPTNLLTDTKTQLLLTEAVGVVCATGNVELAELLEEFISDPSDPSVLSDPEVMSILRKLVILHELSERDEDTANMLHLLQTNPDSLKSDGKLRFLLRICGKLLVPNTSDAMKGENFDINRVASSRDIPAEVFEQIKTDKDEADKFFENLPDELFQAIMGDKRVGNSVLQGLNSGSGGSKQDLSKFRQGMAVVVTRASVQAVIPRRFARSVYYGIMPYLLIDEQGFKFFERGLTGRKLAPSRVIENTWKRQDSYYKKQILFRKSGERCSVRLMGAAAPSLQYTCLLPTEPKMLSRDVLRSQPSSRRESHDIVGSRRPSEERSRRSSSRGSSQGDINMYGCKTSLHPHGSTNGHTSPSLGEYKRGPSYYAPPDYQNSSAQNATVPYSYGELEPAAPIRRSDTLTRILDKYSNFSTEKEFGYRSPIPSHSRYGKSTARNDVYNRDTSPVSDEFVMPKTKYQLRKESRERAAIEENEKTTTGQFANISEENEVSPTGKRVFDEFGEGIPKPEPLSNKNGHLVDTDRPDLIPQNEPLGRRNLDFMKDPLRANVDYFNLGRFEDPIADRYARNVSAYTLPEELNDKYGPPAYGYQNPVMDDPTTYGMQGASDFFTPNYCSRYNRNPRNERLLENGRGPQDNFTNSGGNMRGPQTAPFIETGEARPMKGEIEKDEKSELTDKISRFLQPKEREYKYTPIKTNYKRSRFLKPYVDEDYPEQNGEHKPREMSSVGEEEHYPEIDNMRPHRYGVDQEVYPEVASPRSQRYGGPGATRRMTTPHLQPYGSPHYPGQPLGEEVRHTRPIDLDDDLPPRQNFKDTGYQKRMNAIRNALSDDTTDFDEDPEPPYESRMPPQQQEYVAPPSYFQRGGSSMANGAYPNAPVDEDKPWRRHLSFTPKKPFVPRAYEDVEDDSAYDVGYNPRQAERQLASRLAKQYLVNRNVDEE